MGNSHESASFIKIRGDNRIFETCNEKKVDTIFIRSPQTIYITGVSLCSAIQEPARAFITLSDFVANKDLLSQTIDLAIGSDARDTQHYSLKDTIRISKGVCYRIHVEVVGGPTFSYEEMAPHSFHRDLTLEITRELPTLTMTLAKSTKGLESNNKTTTPPLSATPTTKRANTKSKTVKDFEEAVNSQEDPKERKSYKKSTAVVDSKDNSPSTTRNSRTKTTSPLLLRREMSKIKDRAVKVNMISGIAFQRPSSYFSCC